MANRYWVGGSGTWNTSSTTNWSATSGGASGASAPTAADNVFFDQAGTYTVSTGTAVCLNITVSAGVVTFNSTITISGSLFFAVGTVASTSSLNFNSTTTGNTITPNGHVFGSSVTFNGVGGYWTLGSAFSNLAGLALTAGTLDTSTNNYTLDIGTIFTANAANVKRLVLNGSIMNINGGTNSNAFNISNALTTISAGTSSIVFFNAGATINAGVYSGVLTFYNLTFPSQTGTMTPVWPVSGVVFNNYTWSAPSSAGVRLTQGSYPPTFSFTVNGALTVQAGPDPTYRTRWALYVTGTGAPVPVICNGTVNISNADLTGWAASGSGWATATLSMVGNQGNNTGITFPAARTIYWNLPAGGSYFSNGYATSSGGAVSLNNLPLAQDTLVFDVAGLTAGSTYSAGGVGMPKIDASLRTGANTMTFVAGSSTYYFGDVIFGNGCTVTGSIIFVPLITTTQKLTSGGANLTAASVLMSTNFGPAPSNTFQLQDALTCATLGVNNGTYYGSLDLNNFTVTCSTSVGIVISNGKTINFGTGNITITGSGVSAFSYTNQGSLTGTPTVNHTYSGATATTVVSQGYNDNTALNHNFSAGTYSLTFLQTGDGVGNVNFTGFTGTLVAVGIAKIFGNLTLVSGMTLTASANTLTFTAGTGTKTITTAGKTFDFPIAFNGYAGTWAMQDALTMAATRSITLTSGTLQLKSSTTNTVPGGISTSGPTQKYLQSTIAGTAATLSVASGTYTLNVTTIKDSTASGGATFNASGTSTNGGNNTGWNFAATAVRQNGDFFEMF